MSKVKVESNVLQRIIKELFLFYKRIGTRIVLWTEEQEQELEMLYEEYKDSDGTRHNEAAFHCTSVPVLEQSVLTLC